MKQGTHKLFIRLSIYGYLRATDFDLFVCCRAVNVSKIDLFSLLRLRK